MGRRIRRSSASNFLPVHGNRVDRVSRQTVLTIKNNILRDNVGVMAYSGIRTGVTELGRRRLPPSPRSMVVDGDKYTINGAIDLPACGVGRASITP